MSYLPWVAAGLLVLLVVYRLRRTGTKLNGSVLLSPPVIAGVLVIGVATAASSYAVQALRRPGSQSLVDALAAAPP
jgi:hypothetical protein